MTPSSRSNGHKLRRRRSPDESSSMKENRRLDRDSPIGNSSDETNFKNLFGDDQGAVPVQSQTTQGHNLPFNPTSSASSSSSAQDQDLDEAPWSTRATILFAQGIVLTSIVGTVIFFCLRRHVKRSRRFAAQRARARREWVEWMEAMQERTTIRISASAADDVDGLGRDGNGESRGDDLEAVMSMIEEGWRSRGDNGLARLQQQLQQQSQSQQQQQQQQQQHQQQQPTQSSEDPNNVRNNSSSPTHSLLLVPRTILSVLTAPLRALDDAVNSWSTERGGYDAQYFQSVMDRIQREKEERMENPKEREVRLKEAFMKGRMVWELEDDCFVGPECVKGRRETVKEEFTVQRDVHETVVASESNSDCRVVGDYENGSCDGLVADEQQKDPSQTKVEEWNHKAGVEPQDLSRTNTTSGTAHDENATSSTANEPATNLQRAVSFEEESEEPKICNEAKCSETEHSKAMDDVETIDKLHKGEESNDCSQVAETLTQNETAMAPRDNGESNEFIYLAVPNRPRNRTVSEPCAQDILELAQSSSASASAPFPDDELRLSRVEHDDDFSSTQPIRRPIPNQCAICLCDYEPGDTIVVSASSSLCGNNGDGTSANQRGSHCPHAFHQECIVEWLVKMQDGTPCPCCRQTFVELDDHIPHGANTRSGRATVARASTNASTVSETSTLQGVDEAERARQERRRRHIELGIQRGGRAFHISAISFGTRANAPLTPQELEEAARIRQERRRRHIELGIQRGGRAFDFSRISMR